MRLSSLTLLPVSLERLTYLVATEQERAVHPWSLRESGLLVVDVQCGFTELCPAELPVPGGLEIVPAVNRLLELSWARIDASQDWHPPDHRSFFGRADNLYPPHCVIGTPGAAWLNPVPTASINTRSVNASHVDGLSAH